jgi:hypothetical protein|tara:strand:- start:14 stop:154 length:141 start_codon:yes stop_codon:yes gene_type:complete
MKDHKSKHESKYDTENPAIMHAQFKFEFYISFTDYIISLRKEKDEF